MLRAVKFISKGDKDFGITVRKRVSDYFKEKNIARTGDYRIWVKVFVLPMLLLVPFALILTNFFTGSLFLFYALWLLMGIGLAGCGLGIMHDACHGAISKKQSVNQFIGALVLNLAGGSTLNWKIQHNVLHHSYTNIDGYDEDIDPSGIMRFSPHQPVKSYYRFQTVYAWFLYGLMTFEWATFKDFLQLKRYNQKGLLAQNTTADKELAKLIILKVLYYSLFIVLPILLLDIAWWHIVLGWFSMHFVAGLILGCVFQPAHVVPSSEFPLPDKDNHVAGDWAIHQLLTTANFAPTNRILSWYVGGLNYQIEHHLFPNMSHVHHRTISKIVKRTAEEFGLPYYSQPTFVGALANHASMLHKLRK
ncbi:MAG: acyl-CoA desaturase [Cytophagales bacterium]|nr:acyl-CoA desaturase [Cytophagales bacterium]